MKMLSQLFGSNERELRRLAPLVNEINRFEASINQLSDQELMAKTAEFRQRIDTRLSPLSVNVDSPEYQAAARQILDELLPEAFAVVREAAQRTIGQRHYDVQLIGGIVLHQGKIAEMKTGEGKTLVATLPLYLNALLGQGAHLVTVNDFLAKYHAQWMGRVFAALGLKTASIEHERSYLYQAAALDAATEADLEAGYIDTAWPDLVRVDRQTAYLADVTYGTNNEFGFDYLRDNMVYRLADQAQRRYFAIVDEVDSILIDEARTPLIISAPAEASADYYQVFARLVQSFTVETDYTLDEKERVVSVTPAGIAKIETALKIENLYSPAHVDLVHQLESALKAKALYSRDKEYVVQDGEIVIVDEFTGRLMAGRRFSEGLHQAIEAKEGVVVQNESNTLATISFQNFFRLYPRLAGMTGTAETEAEELAKIYNLDVVVIPTHRPNVRIDFQDQIFQTEAAKFAAVVTDVASRHALGQPVLIGTISVEKNELLSKLLTAAKVPHRVLNAKLHTEEAVIIAQAGRLGAVTVATNMAGRGVDIILGGLPNNSDEAAKVRELGGLHVIGTERHESRRIDNQLRGRSGRQGVTGSSIFYVALDDDLMRIFGGERLKGVMDRLGLDPQDSIEHPMVSRSLESAQKRVEGNNFDIRKHLVEYDDVMNRHRSLIYAERQRILALRPTEDDWLHRRIIETLAADERRIIDVKVERYGLPLWREVEQAIFLRVIDSFWLEHLNSMQQLRDGIGLQAYGQHDPLVEYKHQAYELFQTLRQRIETQAINVVLRAEPQLADGTVPSAQGPDLSQAKAKPNRNDPCFCGSGQKYKKCHGK